MNKISASDVIVQSISIGNFRDLLMRSGWKHIDHANDKILLFEGPNDDEGKPLRLIIPRDHDLEDANTRLAEALNLFAVVHREPLDYVIERVSANEKGADQAIDTHITNTIGAFFRNTINASVNKPWSSATLWERMLANLVLLICSGALGAGLIVFYSHQTLWQSRREPSIDVDKIKANKLAEALSTIYVFQTSVSDLIAQVELKSDSGPTVFVRIPPHSDPSELRRQSEAVQTLETRLSELLNRNCILFGEDTCSKLIRYAGDTVDYYADVRRGTATRERIEERARLWNELNEKLKQES